MITKRDLGIGYLLGTGVGLSISLVGLFMLREEPLFLSLFETLTALILSGALLYVGYWLLGSDLDEDHVWAVARWSTIGLAIPSVVAITIVFGGFTPALQFIVPSMIINNIAAGGVAGVLIGSIVELHKEHNTTQELNQRNLVMNRVLRHNIRNDMNIILGYAQQLENELESPPEEIVGPIQQKAMEVVDLSRSARRIEAVEETEGDPVEVTQIIEEQVQSVQTTHPDATIEADLPRQTWVFADSMLKSVIENVVENAIEHNDRTPEIQISVRQIGDAVEVRVADNGPGIPDQERRVLGDGDATQLRHGNGLGLWLVKWFVDHYGGTLSFEDNEPRGTVVVLHLPVAESGIDETGTAPTAADKRPAAPALLSRR